MKATKKRLSRKKREAYRYLNKLREELGDDKFKEMVEDAVLDNLIQRQIIKETDRIKRANLRVGAIQMKRERSGR